MSIPNFSTDLFRICTVNRLSDINKCYCCQMSKLYEQHVIIKIKKICENLNLCIYESFLLLLLLLNFSVRFGLVQVSPENWWPLKVVPNSRDVSSKKWIFCCQIRNNIYFLDANLSAEHRHTELRKTAELCQGLPWVRPFEWHIIWLI